MAQAEGLRRHFSCDVLECEAMTDEEKKPYDLEDKLFIGFMAVVGVVLASLFALLLLAILVALWKAGLVAVAAWTCIFTVFYYVSRAVYRLIIRNEWI